MGSLNFNVLKDFYKDKQVLVTGDTGFKGSWLVHWLKELGANVTGVSLTPEPNSHYLLTCLDKTYESARLDIRDRESLVALFKKTSPGIVFHLAAQAIVRTSYEDPAGTYSTNVMGTLNIMDAIRATDSVRSFVNVTSDKCYKNKEWIYGYRETDELGGHDPYSSSKACVELLFESYRLSFFQKNSKLGAASVRAGNVIGGGDYAVDRIVPDIVRSLLKNQLPELRNPNSTRPWQHVLEPIGGYMLLGAKLFEQPLQYAGAWNFGPLETSVRTVEELTTEFLKYWGKSGYEKIGNKDGLHEASLLRLNIDKATTMLSWRPVWDFKATIAKTVHWYNEARTKDPKEITKLQIREYMGMI